MNQVFLEKMLSGLINTGSFSDGRINIFMEDYYQRGPEGRKLNPNWHCVLSRDVQEQTQGQTATPQEIYRAIPDSQIKDQTNLPIMSHENYFKIVRLARESEDAFAAAEALLLSAKENSGLVKFYLSDHAWYDELVREDKLDITSTVSDFLSREEDLDLYSENRPAGSTDYRQSLPLLSSELERVVIPVLPSREEAGEIKDSLEQVYRKVDEYVQVGEDIFTESRALSDDINYSSRSLDRLFFQLWRLANNEQYADNEKGRRHITPRMERLNIPSDGDHNSANNNSFEPFFMSYGDMRAPQN